jgi:hypothetical protein
MASPCEESRASLWDKLVPDLQHHIYGLAVEQHHNELMQSQICPGIIHAAIKRNQAAYQQVDDQIDELTLEGQGLATLWQARDDIEGAFEATLDAFLRSIASLPRHIRRTQIRQLRDVIPHKRWSRAFRKRERERKLQAARDSRVWLSETMFVQENGPVIALIEAGRWVRLRLHP